MGLFSFEKVMGCGVFLVLFLFLIVVSFFRAEDTSMLVQILVWFSLRWHSVTSTPLVSTVF